jgi:indole-3-glycerol phosphate synthase
MSILDEIFAHKREELAERITAAPSGELERRALRTPTPLDFSLALQDESRAAPRLIAEIKQRSPSKGVLRADFDALALARTYADEGAAAISALTDERYFGGSLERLRAIADLNLGLPLLRKDFIFERYQLLEARLAGASAILLIVAMLDDAQLKSLIADAQGLALTPLVEVHDRHEYQRALHAGARVVGVNNRNLHDFSVHLETTFDLLEEREADTLFVSESGIRSAEDVRRMGDAGVDAILVGEALVTATDVAARVRELSGVRMR